jgi:hypothetical protein
MLDQPVDNNYKIIIYKYKSASLCKYKSALLCK